MQPKRIIELIPWFLLLIVATILLLQLQKTDQSGTSQQQEKHNAYNKVDERVQLFFGKNYVWVRQKDGSAAIIDTKTNTFLSRFGLEYPPFLDETILISTSTESKVAIVTRKNDWEYHWEQQEYYDIDSGDFLGATLMVRAIFLLT